jgi:hypothetical protein
MSADAINHYRDEIEALRKLVNSLKGECNKAEKAMHGIISASLYNLMPTIAVERHDEVINNINFFQKWAIKDQNYVGLIDSFQHDGPQPDFTTIRDTPTIFCSYHLGSYRLLVPYLVSQGLSITLLIDSAVARMQANDFRSVVTAADPDAITDGRFEILDTAKSNLVIAMNRALRRGRSLIVFIDGNSGANGNEAYPNSMERLSFMGQTMYARKGIGFLSHLANVSITPVVLQRTGAGCWENRVHWYPQIIPQGGDRSRYVNMAVSRLYSILEGTLSNAFEQWESWRYIEKSLAIRYESVDPVMPSAEAISKQSSLLLNTKRYAKYQMDAEQRLLFDRSSYRSTFISSTLSTFLDGFASPQTVEASLSHPNMTMAAMQTLLAKEILVFNEIEKETQI